MELTYDAVIDNGLYVLSYYLSKDIKDITYEDIENNIDMMCDKIVDFFKCEKYANIKSMCFTNSVLTQKTDQTLAEKLKEFLKDKGDEYCAICGKHHAKIHNDIGRSYILNTTAHTFYNFSNNLQGLNICPYCLILTMYAGLNFRVCSGLITIYNTTNARFMKAYTKKVQKENLEDIELKASKSKDKHSSTEYLEKLLKDGILLKGNVEQYRFNNSGQGQEIEVNTFSNESVQLLNKLSKNALLDEFKGLGLMWNVAHKNLSNVYLYKIYDFEKEELKSSKELFDFLNIEVNKLDNKIVELIKRMSIDLKNKDSKMDIRKITSDIKTLNSFSNYDKLIINLKEDFDTKTEKSLFDVDEYVLLSDRRKWSSIKNLLLVSLI